MITDERDIEKIIKLARERKQISKIWEEDFSQYDYWDIYFEIQESGEISVLGTKRKTKKNHPCLVRLGALVNTNGFSTIIRSLVASINSLAHFYEIIVVMCGV